MKKNFYLYKSGELQRKDSSLILKEKNGNVIYIPIEQINLIICCNDIVLNKRALGLLNYYSVSIIFFNYYGDYIGRFTPKKYNDGKILINQVKSYESSQRLIISKIIIYTEIKNSISLLKYYHKKNKNLENQIQSINQYLKDINNMNSVEELLLLEAQMKKVYYSSFDIIIKNKTFQFKQRSYYPPKNEVNALLSYGYAILYANILSELDKSPLLPQISYIHSLSKQTDSLQFDLADMMKPIFVDRLVFRLINKGQIKLSHFEYKNEDTCYLNKEGIKLFLESYEKFMNNSIKISGKYYSYHNLITKEVYRLANYLYGRTNDYRPYVMEW